MILRVSLSSLLSSEGFLFSIRSIDLLAFIGPCFSLFVCFSLAIIHILGPVTHIFKIARCCSEFYAYQPVWVCSPLYTLPSLEQFSKTVTTKIVAHLEDDRWWTVFICNHLTIFKDVYWFFLFLLSPVNNGSINESRAEAQKRELRETLPASPRPH